MVSRGIDRRGEENFSRGCYFALFFLYVSRARSRHLDSNEKKKTISGIIEVPVSDAGIIEREFVRDEIFLTTSAQDVKN